MPSEFQLRKDIVLAGKRLYAKSLIVGTEGNISARTARAKIIATPKNVNKGFLDTESLAIVDLETGKSLSKAQPSSEIKMHLHVYRSRPEANAVVHAHPPVATGFSVAGIDLAQCILPELILTVGPVPLTRYGTPSTEEVPKAILPHIHKSNAFLLANHGALTLGKSIDEATDKMEMVEQFARVLLVARALGNVNVLPKEEVSRLIELRKLNGQEIPPSICESCNYCEKTPVGKGKDKPLMKDEELLKLVTSTVREMMK
ncbi:MAG: class II aldolase/adducin family protein [Candidatus Eisenbacteria bacterium]|nr:class II aldolase/adducin family protein [Candidatus Eisenbacteria bacterium]